MYKNILGIALLFPNDSKLMPVFQKRIFRDNM